MTLFQSSVHLLLGNKWSKLLFGHSGNSKTSLQRARTLLPPLSHLCPLGARVSFLTLLCGFTQMLSDLCLAWQQGWSCSLPGSAQWQSAGPALPSSSFLWCLSSTLEVPGEAAGLEIPLVSPPPTFHMDILCDRDMEICNHGFHTWQH